MRQIPLLGRGTLPLVFLTLFLAAGAPAIDLVRIGVCLPLSGDFASQGGIYLTGVQLRMEDHNARADEYGYRIELVVRDDRSDPRTATAIAYELIENEEVAAIIGSATSGITLAMAPLVRQNGVALVSPSATSALLGTPGDSVFRVLFDDAFQGKALARYLRLTLRLRSAAVIGNVRYESYTRPLEIAFHNAFTDDGGEIVFDQTYDRGLVGNDNYDFTPLLDKAKRARPEAILLPGYADDVSAIARASLAVGLETIFCGGDAWHKDSILTESGNNIDGACYVGSMDDAVDSQAMRDFMNLLDRSNDTSAETASALGYDALSLLIEAMQNGRGRAEIREGMYDIYNFPLVSGRITIDRKEGIKKPAYIVRIGREGSNFVRKVVAVVEPDSEHFVIPKR